MSFPQEGGGEGAQQILIAAKMLNNSQYCLVFILYIYPSR